jgi:hypothetical protein
MNLPLIIKIILRKERVTFIGTYIVTLTKKIRKTIKVKGISAETPFTQSNHKTLLFLNESVQFADELFFCPFQWCSNIHPATFFFHLIQIDK